MPFLKVLRIQYAVLVLGVILVPVGRAQPVPTDQNLLAQASAAVGVRQCQPAIARMAALTLIGATEHDVLVDWDKKTPDTGPFFSLIGMSSKAGAALASVVAIPRPGGECAISAERFSSAPFTCDSIAQVELQGYRPTRLYPGFTVYSGSADPNSTVALIDAPPSCLIMRRYVQFDWRPPSGSPHSPVSSRP